MLGGIYNAAPRAFTLLPLTAIDSLEDSSYYGQCHIRNQGRREVWLMMYLVAMSKVGSGCGEGLGKDYGEGKGKG